MNEFARTARPEHVPTDRVFDFDLYNRDRDPRLANDLHEGLTYLLTDAPDVFWTPHNGGHWVVTPYALLRDVVLDTEHFSTSVQQVPPPKENFVAIPLNVDPPKHAPYRHIIMRYLAPKVIKQMEDQIRARAVDLIDAVADQGQCDFVADIAIPFPVSIFMEMIGWPLERMGEFRELTDEFFSGPTEARRDEIIGVVLRELGMMLDERAIHPRDDLMSRMIAEDMDGRKLTKDEMLSMCFFLFIAGLDTVANAAGFFLRTLARSPGLQAQLVEYPERINQFVDEALRTCGVVNTVRIVKEDVDVGGVTLRAGEMVVLMLTLAGLDERLHDSPKEFDMDRRSHLNLMFGSGVHLCAGHHLARSELRILITEWLKRIPAFAIAPDFDNAFRLGTVMALRDLPLVWSAKD